MTQGAQITNYPTDITCAKNFIYKCSATLYNTMTQLVFHDLPNRIGLIGCYYTLDGL